MKRLPDPSIFEGEQPPHIDGQLDIHDALRCTCMCIDCRGDEPRHCGYQVCTIEPHGSGADPFGRPDPRTHPEYWTE